MSKKSNKSNSPRSSNPTSEPPPQSIGEGEQDTDLSHVPKSPPIAMGGDLEGGKESLQGWAHTHTDRAIYDDIKERARAMRKNPTPTEEKLWTRLRKKQVNGMKFRRQVPIGQFIVDFYCPEIRLVIEVDGSVHDEPEVAERDAGRQQHLESLGLRVIRFTNAQVIRELDAVIERIGDIVTDQT